MRGYKAVLTADSPLPERLTALATAMLASFATDIAVMMRDMTHIKDPTNQETVYRAFQEEVFLPLAESIGAGLGIPDGRRGEFYAWAYLGLVNTFIGKSERLAIPPELLAEQLVAFFFLKVLFRQRRSPG